MSFLQTHRLKYSFLLQQFQVFEIAKFEFEVTASYMAYGVGSLNNCKVYTGITSLWHGRFIEFNTAFNKDFTCIRQLKKPADLKHEQFDVGLNETRILNETRDRSLFLPEREEGEGTIEYMYRGES